MATNPESLGAELLNLQELETLYGNIRGSGGPHVDVTGAQLPPDGSPLITEDETIPSTAVTASQLVSVSETPDVAGTGDVVETTVRRALPQEPDGNVTPVGEEVEEEVRADSMGDAAMTTTTSPGQRAL